MVRRARWLNVSAFWLISIRLLNSQAVQIEFTDNMCSLEESNRKQTLAQIPPTNVKIGTCVHIQRSEAVDELLIIPQAYVVSSRMGGWVSPSPEQAAKHIFNTPEYTRAYAWWIIGNSASHVKSSNQGWAGITSFAPYTVIPPRALGSRRCFNPDGQNTQVTELPRNLNLKQKSNQPQTQEYTTTHRCLHNK